MLRRVASTVPLRLLLGILVLVALAVYALVWGNSREEMVQRHQSPDGRFEVQVSRRPGGFAMPGDASGSPGTVRLVERESGRVLGEAPVEQVQLAERVIWTDSSATIRLIADWPLPR